MNNIAHLYSKLGDVDKALDYFGRGLKFQEEEGDKEGIALSLNNLAYIYDSQGDTLKALDFLTRSLKMFEEMGDKERISILLMNIARIYLYTDGYADKYGGPKGKKFKYKQLNDLLLILSSQPLIEQKHV